MTDESARFNVRVRNELSAPAERMADEVELHALRAENVALQARLSDTEAELRARASEVVVLQRGHESATVTCEQLRRRLQFERGINIFLAVLVFVQLGCAFFATHPAWQSYL